MFSGRSIDEAVILVRGVGLMNRAALVFYVAALMLLGLLATGREDDLSATTTECALDRPETSSAVRKQRKALFAADWSLEMDPVRSVRLSSIDL